MSNQPLSVLDIKTSEIEGTVVAVHFAAYNWQYGFKVIIQIDNEKRRVFDVNLEDCPVVGDHMVFDLNRYGDMIGYRKI